MWLGKWVTSTGIIAKMATSPEQLLRSIASAVARAVEMAVDQASASLPSLPGNSGFAPVTQEECNIDVSLLKHPSRCRGDDLCVDVINKKIIIVFQAPVSRNAPDKRKVQKFSFPRKYSYSFPINMQPP